MSDQTAPTYLEPLRDELDRLGAENERLNRSIDRARMERAQAQDAETVACIALEEAEARVDQLTDLLDDRSAALNRTGASNDTMRATLTTVAALADRWEKYAETIDPMSTTNAASIAALATMKGAYQGCAEKIHAALAVPTDQETAK